MSGIRFPRKMQRWIDGSYDPLDIFQELIDVPAVTFNEYLVYEYLLEEAEHLRDRLAASQRDKLGIRFTEAGQLLVSWRGRPDDSSKSILIAHVDTESFLVRKFDYAAGIAVCWHTSARAPEKFVGSRVRLFSSDQRMSGVIESVNKFSEATRENPFDHEVIVRIHDRPTRDRNTGFLKNDYFDGYGYYFIEPFTLQGGIISAIHVDNTAGVSVLVSLLTAVVRNSWRVNVDFLFTTCEEAGFCGIVGEILSGEHLSAKNGADIMCVVVDSSSHADFVAERQLGDRGPMSGDAERKDTISLNSSVIRTGDWAALFDSEVARLLSVAASNLRTSPSRNGEFSWAGRKKPSISAQLRDIPKTGKSDGRAHVADTGFLLGRMRGGWCEATPLMLASALRGSSAPPLNLRVGAVAIPIANYRNYYENALYPEKCHESSLRSGCQLLGEALRLLHRWPFDLNGTAEIPIVSNREARIKELLAWQVIFAGLSSVTKNWIASLHEGRTTQHPRKGK